jgi:FAD/FMN-containing dehydrogenase
MVGDFAESVKNSGKAPSIREVELPEKTKEYRAVKIPNPWAFLYADHRDGGAVYWCGSFMPSDTWVDAYKNADRIMSSHGFAPATRVSMFRGSHYGMFRSIIPYNKNDEKEVENVRQAARKLVKNVIDHGGVVYKAPTWATDIMLNSEHADPGFKEFMRQIKDTLDPNRIMNPGKWGL